MAAAKDDASAPIIIKRVKKHGHGHHGGSWKVAFADFATAMMAFFLLMWLMGSTTEEQKGAISEYFNNPSATPGTSSSPVPSSVQGPGGASTSMIQLGGGMELNKTTAESEDAREPQVQVEVTEQAELEAELKADAERLEGLMGQLREAIDQRETLAAFKDQILLDVTPEGIRIQIVDHERRPMFPLGSAVLEEFSANILRELAGIVNGVPNRLSISGHTDVRPYVKVNYSNWELSADRANAARRALLTGGLPAEKIGRVVGLASSVLLDADTPDSPLNRRISIIVMNKRTEAAIFQENGALFSVQDPAESSPGGVAPASAPEVSTAMAH